MSPARTLTKAQQPLSGGLLYISNDTALGTTDAGTTVVKGAGLRLQGGITVAEALTLNGNGIGAGAYLGSLVNTSGHNTVTGLVTLGYSSAVGSTGGTLEIAGGMACGGNSLSVATYGGDIVIQRHHFQPRCSR